MSSSAALNNLKTQMTVLQIRAAIQSSSIKGFVELIIKSVTHSCDGGPDLSSLGGLKVWSVANTTSSFFE